MHLGCPSMAVAVTDLAPVPAFGGLSLGELESLASTGERVEVEGPGVEITQQGDFGHSVFAVLAGDARVRQFWDGKKIAGKAFGKRHYPEAAGTAWDIYLFYRPDAAWSEPCPLPQELLKQFDWKHDEAGTATSVLTRGKWEERFESDLPRESAEAFDRLSASN